MCDCDYHRSMDIVTPRNVYLSAYYKRSFAFYSVKHREPVILTNIIDTLSRSKEEIGEKFGNEAKEELKAVIGELSKLNYEIQTNKPIEKINDNGEDAQIYNDLIDQCSSEEGRATHFHTIWLLTECYMYRRVRQAFLNTTLLKEYDPFITHKENAFYQAVPLIKKLSKHLLNIIHVKGGDESIKNEEEIKEHFINLIKVNLWGNKCDLSLSLGRATDHDALFNVESLNENILCDHSEKIWEAAKNSSESSVIDIIFDNSGYELFTDLCLADYIISKNLSKTVRFYVKSMPWFISDVMVKDFNWTIEQLAASKDQYLNRLGTRWQVFIKEGSWQIVDHWFWTTPHDYSVMKTVAPDLYTKLSESKLVIFKGDLNYRKLFGEKNWAPTTSVEVALQGFHPTKLCTLRTMKAHIVCGLKEGLAEKIQSENEKWMETGDYGLIQFCGKVVQLN